MLPSAADSEDKYSRAKVLTSIAGYRNRSSISKSALLAQRGITVPIADGWHMVQISDKQRITGYSVKISRSDSIIFQLKGIKGFEFSSELLDFIKSSAHPGDEIIFFDIDSIIFESEERKLRETYNLVIRSTLTDLT